MGLKNLVGIRSLQRHSWFIILVLFTFLLIGCGQSEEATKEEAPQAQEVKPAEPVAQETPKVENPSDQALTSFVGADTEPVVEVPPPAPAVSPTLLTQYEKQIETLRTENTSLKQNIVKLEQENRNINARMMEIDAKYAAAMTTNSELATKKVEVKETNEEVSELGYNNAMKAFNARKYESAAKSFKAISQSDNKDLANRATYWLGESYYAQKKYQDALSSFQEVLKAKSSEKKADAQFMLAKTYENLGSKAKAKAAYEKVVKNYPMSKNVKTAKARWAKL
jgi:TolA-binding protein